jgi:hypothetical protein
MCLRPVPKISSGIKYSKRTRILAEAKRSLCHGIVPAQTSVQLGFPKQKKEQDSSADLTSKPDFRSLLLDRRWYCMRAKVSQTDILQRIFMTGFEHNPRGDACLERLLPPQHAQTPFIAILKAGKSIGRRWSPKVVTARRTQLQKIVRDNGANRVPPKVLRSRLAVPVAEKTCPRRLAAALQFRTKHVSWARRHPRRAVTIMLLGRIIGSYRASRGHAQCFRRLRRRADRCRRQRGTKAMALRRNASERYSQKQQRKRRNSTRRHQLSFHLCYVPLWPIIVLLLLLHWMIQASQFQRQSECAIKYI